MKARKSIVYKHEESILRFMDNYDVSYEEASDIFKEMIKLLMLIHEYKDDEYVFTHEPLWIIDEMWHTFLMYSLDYKNFCLDHFGRVIEHQPTPRAIKLDIIQKLDIKEEATTKKVSDAVRRLYELIYDFLGKETLIKWIKDYGEKYTIDYVNSIRKPIV